MGCDLTVGGGVRAVAILGYDLSAPFLNLPKVALRERLFRYVPNPCTLRYAPTLTMSENTTGLNNTRL